MGEIDDEYDEETRSQVSAQPDGTFILDGMLAVRDANRRFNLRLPEDGRYTTVAGFMLAHAGRMLAAGDEVGHAGALLRVERVERRRIRRVRLTTPTQTDGGHSTLEALLPLVGAAALTGAGTLLG